MEGVISHEQFTHVRIFVGIVTGLSVARLLTGLARFVQHPDHEQIYSVHLCWTFYLLLSVIHFWWFQFGLSRLPVWTFPVYFFVISYAAIFFLVCAILFPDRMEEYSSFRHFFHARQTWFYGLLAGMTVVDIADTAVKGFGHLIALGPAYLLRQAVFFVFAVIAMFVRNRRFHIAFVVAALASEIAWILLRYDVLE